MFLLCVHSIVPVDSPRHKDSKEAEQHAEREHNEEDELHCELGHHVGVGAEVRCGGVPRCEQHQGGKRKRAIHRARIFFKHKALI